MAETISFDEKTNTWTSRWGYNPEWMTRLNRGFFSFKKGQLYRHHSEIAPRNYFYNDDGNMEIQNSSVTVAFNQDPSDIKHFKTISLESNTKYWDVDVETNLDRGHINGGIGENNFDTREGEHYSIIYRNADSELDFSHLSIQGVGVCTDVSSNVYTFSDTLSFLSTEDNLYYVIDENTTRLIGKIVDFTQNTITIQNPQANQGSVGDFCFVAKNPLVESNGIKGNHAKITLTTTDSENEATLFAVNTEVFKSFQ